MSQGPGGWPTYPPPPDQGPQPAGQGPSAPGPNQYANYAGPDPGNFGPPRQPKGPVFIASVAIVAAVVLGVVAAVGYSSATRPATAPTPSKQSSWTIPSYSMRSFTPPTFNPPSVTIPTPEAPNTPTLQPDPVIPGWKVAVSPRHGANYDVPATWEIQAGTSVGYESKGGPIIGKSTLAQFGRGKCGKDYQSPADAGLMGPGTEAWDPAESASRLATRWAKARNTNDAGELLGEPPAPKMTTVQLKQGSTAQVATVTLKPGEPSPGECNSTSVRFTVAAVEFDGGKRAILVIRNAQNIPDAVTTATEREIITTLRPQ